VSSTTSSAASASCAIVIVRSMRSAARSGDSSMSASVPENRMNATVAIR
jgi:hypothetical protein